MAKQLGASQDLLDAMFNIDQHRNEFSAAELAALTLAERMTTDARNVDEEVWAELRAHYDDGQIIELASVIGLFNYFNRFNDALRVEITPPGQPPASSASE
ncbi:MAG: carboxymuconolactone decarboxylase family protein [Ktedonobacterales bacterium]